MATEKQIIKSYKENFIKILCNLPKCKTRRKILMKNFKEELQVYLGKYICIYVAMH